MSVRETCVSHRVIRVESYAAFKKSDSFESVGAVALVREDHASQIEPISFFVGRVVFGCRDASRLSKSCQYRAADVSRKPVLHGENIGAVFFDSYGALNRSGFHIEKLRHDTDLTVHSL